MGNNVSRRTFVRLAGSGAAAAALGSTAELGQAHAAHGGNGTGVSPRGVSQMPAIDPQMQMVLDELVAFEAPMITDMTPFNARQADPLGNAVRAVIAKQGKPAVESVVNVAHRLIPGGAGQQLLIRIYQPAGEGPFPALVYFHGGGWVISGIDGYDASCRAIVNAANCAVISVAYRQAPEYKFPAAPMDAYAAYTWVVQNAASIRVDPSKIAVGGESAGGNLATVTALMARDRKFQMPVHQLLVYPVTIAALSGRPDFASYGEFTSAMPLSTPLLDWFYRYYLRNAADGNNPYASPFRANVAGLPPATVITAEIDPLRDEGEAYAQKLKDAGIPTTMTRYMGVTHEFFGMAGIIDKAKQAVAEAAAGLKGAFGTT